MRAFYTRLVFAYWRSAVVLGSILAVGGTLPAGPKWR